MNRSTLHLQTLSAEKPMMALGWRVLSPTLNQAFNLIGSRKPAGGNAQHRHSIYSQPSVASERSDRMFRPRVLASPV